ncbi:unnamed protein product, partial [Discosporangium mesarthrocarpum]
AERRHGKPPKVEPIITIPKHALAAAVAVLVLGVIMGIKTSIQAAGNGAPFNIEKVSKKTGFSEEGSRNSVEKDVRDRDIPNGGWLEDTKAIEEFGLGGRCDFQRVHHSNMTTKRFSREFEGVQPVVIEGFIQNRWPALFSGRWARPS